MPTHQHTGPAAASEEQAYTHTPVLLAESVAALQVRPDGRYVDGTFGRGGHARAVLARLGPAGRLLAFDQDPQAVAAGAALQAEDTRFEIVHTPFTALRGEAQARGWLGRVHGVLLDLGVSSPQLEDPTRGFSFLRDGPLDMRMDPRHGVGAAEWLEHATQDEIADVLYHYGEERHARRIARAIVAARREARIATTGQLAALVAQAHPAWKPDKHPATQTFQAIRIFLNRELDMLEETLAQALEVLAPGGRLAVISFHSLEDRIVKRFVRDQARGDPFPPGVPVRAAQLRQTLRPVGKALSPGDEEVRRNPRARSAVLRVAERA